MNRIWGYISGILAMFFFGISSPINKIMLYEMDPLVIAAFTYLIAGIFLFSIRLSPLKERILDFINHDSNSEIFISKKDYIIILLTAIFSSVIGPIAFLYGLRQTSAIDASLLLNTEVLFIIFMSFIIFKDILKRKDVFGIFLIVLGAIVLATKGEFDELFVNQNFIGSLLIISASFFWSVDTVLSKFLSNKRDLILISALKSSIGGLLLFLIILIIGIDILVPYDLLSLLLFTAIFSVALAFIVLYFALREIGSSRVGAIFPLASLFGSVSAFLILGESFSILEIIFGSLMLLGVYILYWDPKLKGNKKPLAPANDKNIK
ncbi:MAG: DMT family transporter [Euryarchaeota archaeon]